MTQESCTVEKRRAILIRNHLEKINAIKGKVRLFPASLAVSICMYTASPEGIIMPPNEQTNKKQQLKVQFFGMIYIMIIDLR